MPAPKGYAGTLEVHGTLDIDQFWPTGESDADTSHVVVDPDGFKFRPNAGAQFTVTHVLDDAQVKGTGTEPAVKKGAVTVRWQGIDAPELHYRPVYPTKLSDALRQAFNQENGNFRQHYGERATVALATFLKTQGQSPLHVIVRTAVDAPNDVFDTYGRLIGDIVVVKGGQEVDVNEWLVAEGWAFPTYYDSMSAAEIQKLDKLAAHAKETKAGIWKDATEDASHFDPSLKFRSHGAVEPDSGAVIMPKVFRRLATYSVAEAAGVIDETFAAYLKAHPDKCHKASDFLQDGKQAPQHRLDQFVNASSHLSFWPQDLVFEEASSKLLDAQGNPITKF
jgi:endonuclease YncB( thermonuclease family)